MYDRKSSVDNNQKEAFRINGPFKILFPLHAKNEEEGRNMDKEKGILVKQESGPELSYTHRTFTLTSYSGKQNNNIHVWFTLRWSIARR